MDPEKTPGADSQQLSPSSDATSAAVTSNTPDATSEAHASDTPSSSTPGNDTSTPVAPKEPSSMEEAIEAALNATIPGEKPAKADAEDDAQSGPDGAGSTEPSEQETGTDDDDATDDTGADVDLPDDPTDEELASYKAKPAKRVRKLLAQRQAAQREVAGLKPDAENYRAIRSFMEKNALADAEVADLFQIGAQLKSGTPEGLQAFLQRVEPLVQQAREALGQAIPADLQPQVQTGEVTEDMARELARQRYAAQQASAAAQRAQQQVAQQATMAGQQQIAQVVNDWSARKAASDPDFALKQKVMRRVAQAMVAERGLPRTVQEALEVAEQTYAEATELLKSARPAKAPTRPAPSGTSPTSTGITPAPQSLEEVIEAGLRV